MKPKNVGKFSYFVWTILLLKFVSDILISNVRYFTVPTISLKKFDVNVFEKVKNVSLISKVDNGELISKEYDIDTSKVGKIDVKYVVKCFNGSNKEVNFKVNVIDKEAPLIEGVDFIELTEGDKIDLFKDFKVSDNSKEDIKLNIEGDYDLNKAGEYKVNYVGTDSSNNKAAFPVTIKVNKKPINVYPSSTFTTSNGFRGQVINGVTYIDGILIANKTYSLPPSYGSGLTSETYQAFLALQSAASNAGHSIWISSGFRSYSHQNTLYHNYASNDGYALADTYSARPGHSEHQSGLAFDLNSLAHDDDNTDMTRWVLNNCYKYGFILRYPNGKTDETGYVYEWWHLRYVGSNLATKLYNGGNWITLESYFGITSRYN